MEELITNQEHPCPCGDTSKDFTDTMYLVRFDDGKEFACHESCLTLVDEPEE